MVIATSSLAQQFVSVLQTSIVIISSEPSKQQAVNQEGKRMISWLMV
jgi:hypothetical protein